jgi:hypothetical protein
MRSDRNPWFILKKSRDPRIQEWLSKAPGLSEREILGLNIKPDLKRAMIFAKKQVEQEKSQKIADIIAEQMIAQSVESAPKVLAIHQYTGPDAWIKTNTRSELLISHGSYFWLDTNAMFVSHIWCPAQQTIIQNSVFLTYGTQRDLNIHIQKQLEKRSHS